MVLVTVRLVESGGGSSTLIDVSGVRRPVLTCLFMGFCCYSGR